MKFSCISSALFRAYRLSSTNLSLHLEFIKKLFGSNGFPQKTVCSFIRKFLDFQYSRPLQTFDVPKLQKYFAFPYFGAESDKLKRELIDLLIKFYPYLNPKIVLLNTFSIGSFFKYKDRLPKSCQSAVVYQFCCASCGASYVGSTVRNLHSRVQQHLGKSVRTGMFLVKPDPSPIRDHSLACDTLVSFDNFSILEKANNPLDLRILESLHINDKKPSLNNMTSSFPLQTIQ